MIVSEITKKNDEWYTPEEAIYPLIKYLKPNSTIWCPFDESNSNFVKIFRQNGFNVINTHIKNGGDFFLLDVPDGVDYIISNPPYSLKNEVFERLFTLNKPFAMLTGCVGIFESKFRFEMFKDNEPELLVFNKRVKFIADGPKEFVAPPFSSWYIARGIFNKQITFDYLGE